jgi:hypothetical protein
MLFATDRFFVQLMVTASILPHLLYNRIMNITTLDTVFLQTFGNSQGILHIALATGQLLDKIRVGKFQFKIMQQYIPYGIQ